MPQVKNKLQRLLIIDELIKQKPMKRAELTKRLSERLGATVSRHSLDKDLLTLRREFDAPISFQRTWNLPAGYIYTQNYKFEQILIAYLKGGGICQ